VPGVGCAGRTARTAVCLLAGSRGVQRSSCYKNKTIELNEAGPKKMKIFAFVFGVAFLAIGIAGFIPGLTPPHSHPDVTFEAGLGLVFGLFAVNVLHNLFHIVFGIWGLAAARTVLAARTYARAVAVIYTILAVMGLISIGRIYTTFGLIPLYGHVIWLHALLALVAAYFGFMHRQPKYRHAVT
jgi:hypothetical protein